MDMQTSLLDRLFDTGLLIDTGVEGLYGRSGAFEDVIARFERLIDERWRGMGEQLTLCAFNAPGADRAGRLQTGLPDVVESRLRDRRAQWIHVGGMDMRQVRS